MSKKTPTTQTRLFSRGFTLIETFVAITILVTAVAGPLTIASKGLQSAILARDQLTASFLGQEGIEYIREKRDNNKLQGLSWLAGLDACIDQECTVDATEQQSPAINTCAPGGCDAIRFNDESSLYTYSLGDPETQFVRSVTIAPAANGYEATIISTIEWTTGVFTRQAVFSEVITDWQ